MNILKKTKLSLGIIICIIIISIISVVLYLNSKDNNILFKSSYENHAWGDISYGYYIYFNGDIKEYDDYDNDRKLKSAKISNEELKQLKKLASIVKDKYKKENSRIQMFDAGIETKQIYNRRLFKWVILSKSGDTNGENSTETSQKILELTDTLYNKYLNEKFNL